MALVLVDVEMLQHIFLKTVLLSSSWSCCLISTSRFPKQMLSYINTHTGIYQMYKTSHSHSWLPLGPLSLFLGISGSHYWG